MKHISREDMQAYILDKLPDGERIQVEDHLYGCQECLMSSYMEAMEEAQQALPVLTDAEQWTDLVMDTVAPRKRWYEYALLQYGIAAAIMLILTASGLLGLMPAEHAEKFTLDSGADSSYSRQLMERTITMIDHMKVKGGAGHE